MVVIINATHPKFNSPKCWSKFWKFHVWTRFWFFLRSLTYYLLLYLRSSSSSCFTLLVLNKIHPKKHLFFFGKISSKSLMRARDKAISCKGAASCSKARARNTCSASSAKPLASAKRWNQRWAWRDPGKTKIGWNKVDKEDDTRIYMVGIADLKTPKCLIPK